MAVGKWSGRSSGAKKTQKITHNDGAHHASFLLSILTKQRLPIHIQRDVRPQNESCQRPSTSGQGLKIPLRSGSITSLLCKMRPSLMPSWPSWPSSCRGILHSEIHRSCLVTPVHLFKHPILWATKTTLSQLHTPKTSLK